MSTKFHLPMHERFWRLLGRRVQFLIKGTTARYEGTVIEATRYFVALNVNNRGGMTRVTVKYTEIDPDSIENLDLRLVK